MREKTCGINVRVSAEEKAKLSRNAKLCGLNLSEYLRRSGLGKEIKVKTRQKDFRSYLELKSLLINLPELSKEEIAKGIESVLQIIVNL